MTKSTPLGSSKKELKSRTIESYFTPLKKAKLSPSTLETTAKEGANSDTLAFSVQFEQNAKENAEFLANVRGIKSPTTGSMEESVEESNTLFATSMLSSPPAFKSPALSNQKRKQGISLIKRMGLFKFEI